MEDFATNIKVPSFSGNVQLESSNDMSKLTFMKASKRSDEENTANGQRVIRVFSGVLARGRVKSQQRNKDFHYSLR
jgi:hypothetical protein